MSLILGILDSGGAAAGAANSYESIATVTVSTAVASISFTSIPATYTHLQIRWLSRNGEPYVGSWAQLTFNGSSSGYVQDHYIEGDGSSASANYQTGTSWIQLFRPSGSSASANVFGAGDGTGISGSYVAIARGRLAALKIAAELGKISETSLTALATGFQKTFKRRTKFQSAINNAYEIKSGIYALADNKTVICRCESVTLENILPVLESTVDPSVVKAYTRCGMGLCQGRNCQRQISALIAEKQNISIAEISQATPRFPTKPISLGQIADSSITSEKYFIDAE